MLFQINRKKSENNANMADKTLTVSKVRCPQNHKCPAVRVCPVNALTQNGFSAPEVDQEKCVRCSKCVRYCPMGAIKLK